MSYNVLKRNKLGILQASLSPYHTLLSVKMSNERFLTLDPMDPKQRKAELRSCWESGSSLARPPNGVSVFEPDYGL